jgi:hypothetical protein
MEAAEAARLAEFPDLAYDASYGVQRKRTPTSRLWCYRCWGWRFET